MLAQVGLHVLLCIEAFRWYALVGPDDDSDVDWVLGSLPIGDWTATFETVSATLITHFTSF
jgi:hypothetical protein